MPRGVGAMTCYGGMPPSSGRGGELPLFHSALGPLALLVHTVGDEEEVKHHNLGPLSIGGAGVTQEGPVSDGESRREKKDRHRLRQSVSNSRPEPPTQGRHKGAPHKHVGPATTP